MPDDHQILQADLQKFSAWADKWEIKFGINKCCIMCLNITIKVNLYIQCQVKFLKPSNNIVI